MVCMRGTARMSLGEAVARSERVGLPGQGCSVEMPGDLQVTDTKVCAEPQ